MQTVTAYLRVRNAPAAIAYYEKAFGAHEAPGRMTGPDGTVMHTTLTIGNSAIMLSEESEAWGTPGPQTLGGTTVSLSLIVPDVDAVVRRAVDEGATLIGEVADQFYGHRSGRLTDPFGHAWVVGTVIEEVAPDEMKRRMEAWTQANA